MTEHEDCWMEKAALFELLMEFDDRWPAKTCICGGAKWENSPFCRKCSIRLQRVGWCTHRPPFNAATQHSLEAVTRKYGLDTKLYLAKMWDRCRDYLILTGGNRYMEPVRRSVVTKAGSSLALDEAGECSN